jgi:SnoaL-like domain
LLTNAAESPEPDAGAEPGPVETLVALESIRVLKSRYLQAVDEKDWPAIVDIFTEDAVVDFSEEGQYHVGHHGVEAEDIDPEQWKVTGAAATEVIANAVQDIVTVHHGHDPQIVVETAETARGRWSLYDRLEYGDEVMHGYGHYHESYRRVQGKWKISSLKLTRLRVVWSDS